MATTFCVDVVGSSVRAVLNFMLPPRCPGCAAIVAEDHRFCATCWSELHFLPNGGCKHCAMPLGSGDGLTCAQCLAAPPTFDAVIAAVAYGEIAKRVALRLKRARRPGLAHTIAARLAHRLPEDAVLVPVPLHRWRLWSRGFNQSVAIACALNPARDRPMALTSLRRTRATRTMQGLDPAKRRRNVRGAFAVTGRFDGQHVLLVDDVLTTGATAEGCAKALKRAGAARVTVVCWARVVRDD